jgi:hypothetical protein
MDLMLTFSAGIFLGLVFYQQKYRCGKFAGAWRERERVHAEARC